jgi:ribosome recycling factor
MWEQVISEAKNRMTKAIENIQSELTRVRTGRANPSLLDAVKVDYYGAATPLKSLAAISAPEPRMMVIQPFDAGSVAEIVKSIQAADLGLTPQAEGKMIRIPVPSLSKERREELVKLVKKVAEDGRVSVRNVRRDVNEQIKKLEKDKTITEDDREKALAEIQKVTDKTIIILDQAAAAKESELLTV